MEIILPDPETGKRYNSQSAYLKKRFGKKTVKISLNGGFTCPNRDGTKGVGGCTYCSAKGGGDFGGDPAERGACRRGITTSATSCGTI